MPIFDELGRDIDRDSDRGHRHHHDHHHRSHSRPKEDHDARNARHLQENIAAADAARREGLRDHWPRMMIGSYGQRMKDMTSQYHIKQKHYPECNHPEEDLIKQGNQHGRSLACTLCLGRWPLTPENEIYKEKTAPQPARANAASMHVLRPPPPPPPAAQYKAPPKIPSTPKKDLWKKGICGVCMKTGGYPQGNAAGYQTTGCDLCFEDPQNLFVPSCYTEKPMTMTSLKAVMASPVLRAFRRITLKVMMIVSYIDQNYWADLRKENLRMISDHLSSGASRWVCFHPRSSGQSRSASSSNYQSSLAAQNIEHAAHAQRIQKEQAMQQQKLENAESVLRAEQQRQQSISEQQANDHQLLQRQAEQQRQQAVAQQIAQDQLMAQAQQVQEAQQYQEQIRNRSGAEMQAKQEQIEQERASAHSFQPQERASPQFLSPPAAPHMTQSPSQTGLFAASQRLVNIVTAPNRRPISPGPVAGAEVIDLTVDDHMDLMNQEQRPSLSHDEDDWVL